jgi:hypothetical protein
MAIGVEEKVGESVATMVEGRRASANRRNRGNAKSGGNFGP